MEATLQKALADIITKATEGVNAGINFLSAQLPDVVHQLLLWKFTYSLCMFIFGILLLVVSVILSYMAIKKWFEKSEKNIIPICGLLNFPIWIAACCCINLTWLQIWAAPKIYLIEYAATLVKGR